MYDPFGELVLGRISKFKCSSQVVIAMYRVFARTLWSFGFLTLLMLTTLRGSSAATLDQSFEPIGVPGGWDGLQVGRGEYEIAQTVTPSITGLMKQIDVFIAKDDVNGPTSGNLIIDVRPVDLAGEPLDSDASALFNSTIPLSDVSGTGNPGFSWVTVDLGAGLPVISGEKFAIVLRPELPDVSTNTYLWGMTTVAGDNYAAGGLFERRRFSNNPPSSWTLSFNNRDAGFRTFVLIPEPTGAILSCLALAFLPIRRARRISVSA